MLRTEERNKKTTHIDKMSTMQMLKIMNKENANAVKAVGKALKDIEKAVDFATDSIGNGGRLFYIGAGTSGRLGVLDASECVPTFGVSFETVTGIIAGGKECMFKPAESAEDIYENGVKDILDAGIKKGDTLVGISAAGNADYVVGALEKAKELGCHTVSLSCNTPCKIEKVADVNIFTDTGAEVITGSTRLKAGTAQKLVLNMISTFAMVRTGKVYENLMINLKPSNIKLKGRMVRIVQSILDCSEEEAIQKLDKSDWNIRRAVEK